MKKYLLILLAAVFAASACSRYQSVKGDPMNSRIYTLDNGLKVYMTVNKDEPRIQTYIAVRSGGKNDPADNTGLAHYLEHMMFKGTEQFGTQNYEAEKPLLAAIDSLFEVYRTLTDEGERLALYHQIDSISYEASKIAIPNEYDKMMSIIGSEGSNAYTSNDVTCYVEEIPSNQLENWAKIEADRFMNCVFRGFHTELEAVYEEKNMGMASGSENAMEALDSMLFQGHPYGTQTVIGTQDHLKNPSLKAIRRQKDIYYVPNNVAICLSGDFDPEKTLATIKKYFGSWKANPTLPKWEVAPAKALETPSVAEVWGPEADFVMMGWRTPGASSEESDISSIAGSILSNGMAGLIDLDVVQQQKALGMDIFPYNRADYGLFLVEGMPKEGQSLEELRDIVLEEIEKLRDGEFSDELLEAAKANWKLRQMQMLTYNSQRATQFVNSFVNGTTWESEVNRPARIAALTKEDITEWAEKYLADDNYAIVYKHNGVNPFEKKIEAPRITPIVTNRDKQSDFLKAVAADEPAPIEPVFVDYEKDMSVLSYKGLELLYKKNEQNDIAQLSFRYDCGTNDAPALSLASDYVEYLGTPDCSASEFASAMYGLACRSGLSVGSNVTQLSVSVLSENIGKALTLTQSRLNGAKGDDAVLEELKADLIRARSDAKMNQRACNSALQNYVIYGPEFIKKTTLTNDALQTISSEDLLAMLRSFSGKQHKIIYYGPASEQELIKMLEEAHPLGESLEPLQRSYPQKRLTAEKQVFVAPFTARQFNYVQFSNRGEKLNLAQDPYIDLFNEYYGGGMNAIVFQEMRESRALAYSAGAWLGGPSFKDDSYSFRATIASQNDKLQKAVEGFDEIIETLPQATENLEIAKASILGKLRTQRVKGASVLYSYLNAQELGLKEPREKQVFEKVGALTMDDLLATHKQWIAGRTYNYAILGDVKDLDMNFLRSLGPVKQLTMEEIFGY